MEIIERFDNSGNVITVRYSGDNKNITNLVNKYFDTQL